MTEKIRIAVIGSGHLGRFHARLIGANTDFQLVGVVDPLADARNALAQELHVAGFDSYQPLLDKIDAAVIATPTEYHHRVGMELLLAGKHLLIEKPLGWQCIGVRCIGGVCCGRKSHLTSWPY